MTFRLSTVVSHVPVFTLTSIRILIRSDIVTYRSGQLSAEPVFSLVRQPLMSQAFDEARKRQICVLVKYNGERAHLMKYRYIHTLG